MCFCRGQHTSKIPSSYVSKLNQDQHYEAVYTQHQYRKALSTLGRATADEVMESQKRKTMVLVDGKLPLPAGEDFAQQVLNRMDDFKTQMEGLKTQVEDVKTQMGDLKTQVEDVKTQLGDLKTQVEDVKTQMGDLKTQVEGINQANQVALTTQVEEINQANQVALTTQVEGINQANQVALATQMQALTTQMQEINQTNQAQMAVLLAPIAIQTAKNANRSLVHGCEALVQVPNNQGVLPVDLVFPQTIDNLMNMQANDVNLLLTFYGIRPNGRGPNLRQRKEILCRHLGLVYMPN